MFIRIFWIISATLLAGFTTNSMAQENAAPQSLELNLDQFSDKTETAKDLELNLEQFDKTPSDNETDLNLEQFDKKNQESDSVDSDLNTDQFTKANPTSPRASKVERPDRSKFKYKREFIVGGLMFLVFLVIMSRRRRNKKAGRASRM